MALTHKVSAVSATAIKAQRSAVVPKAARSSSLVCRAARFEAVSRRELLAASLVTVGVLAQAPSALASTPEEQAAALAALYQTRTAGIIAEVRSTLDVPRSDPNKQTLVKTLRKDINDYIGDWRVKPKYAGKQSFAKLYIALDAVSGHYNSFGPNAPLPNSRLELIQAEMVKAEEFLVKNK